jgi:hypothetical protein
VKPTAFELFSMYYLGLTPDFKPRFYNLNAVSRHYNTSPDQVTGWLKEMKMESGDFRYADFNLAKAHGDAQAEAICGTQEGTREMAGRLFKEAVEALKASTGNKVYEDINWDDVWGDA